MRWQSLRIAQKIWCGLSILILGNFTLMVFGMINGWFIGLRLDALEKSLFPAVIKSQQALLAFNNQSTRYTEAVMARDPNLLETAQQHALEVNQALETIVALPSLRQENREAVQETLKQFTAFTTSAQTIYAAMSQSSDDQEALAEIPDMKQQAAELAQQTEDLRQALEAFTNVFAETVIIEVSTINARHKQTGDSQQHSRRVGHQPDDCCGEFSDYAGNHASGGHPCDDRVCYCAG